MDADLFLFKMKITLLVLDTIPKMRIRQPLTT